MKLTLSLAFKVLIFSLSIFGIYLTFIKAQYPLEVFSYFTTFVNILTALLYGLIMTIIILRKTLPALLGFFKQSLLIYLVLTMIVYSFVLIPYISNQQLEYQIFSLQDIMIHYLVPLFVILDYVWFDEKGKSKPFYVLTNVLNLLMYLVYWGIYVFFGGRFHLSGSLSVFPYFFLDIDRIGINAVIFNLLTLFIGLLFLGWVVHTIDVIISVPLKLNQSKRK
jgi:hypothetical protein